MQHGMPSRVTRREDEAINQGAKPVPGPRSWTGLHSAKAFRRNPMAFLQQLARDYGDIASFRLGPIQAVFVNHPDLVREVLVTQLDRFPKLRHQTNTIRKIDGNSVFVKEGEPWIRDRRLIHDAFGARRMAGFAKDILDVTSRRITNWRDGSVINFSHETMKLAILIAGRILFGVDLSRCVGELRDVSFLRSSVFVHEMSRIIPVPGWFPLPSVRQRNQVIRARNNLMHRMIREKRVAQDTSAEPDLLSILLHATNETRQSDRQIRDSANMLFQAAVDDVATALLWSFFLVAQNNDVQNRIRREVNDSLSNGNPEFSQLEKAGYTVQVIHETLRLYPSTWIFTARLARKRTAVCDYQINKHSWVFISPFVTQRQERFFENPDQFVPDRFDRSQLSRLQKEAWFPFGMGPRACAGTRFSIMELTLVVATVLREFELELLPESMAAQPTPKVTVRPDRDVQIRVRKNAAS